MNYDSYDSVVLTVRELMSKLSLHSPAEQSRRLVDAIRPDLNGHPDIVAEVAERLLWRSRGQSQRASSVARFLVSRDAREPIVPADDATKFRTYGLEVPEEFLGHPKRVAAWLRGVKDAAASRSLRIQVWDDVAQDLRASGSQMRCLEFGHEGLTYWSGEEPVCVDCGASEYDVLADWSARGSKVTKTTKGYVIEHGKGTQGGSVIDGTAERWTGGYYDPEPPPDVTRLRRIDPEAGSTEARLIRLPSGKWAWTDGAMGGFAWGGHGPGHYRFVDDTDEVTE